MFVSLDQKAYKVVKRQLNAQQQIARCVWKLRNVSTVKQSISVRAVWKHLVIAKVVVCPCAPKLTTRIASADQHYAAKTQ